MLKLKEQKIRCISQKEIQRIVRYAHILFIGGVIFMGY